MTTTSGGRDLRLPVAAGEQHGRRERRAVLEREAVDEQPLALADAVLLAADGDDRVAHARGLLTRKSRAAPASRRIVAEIGAAETLTAAGRSPRSTPTSARSPRRRRPRAPRRGSGRTGARTARRSPAPVRRAVAHRRASLGHRAAPSPFAAAGFFFRFLPAARAAARALPRRGAVAVRRTRPASGSRRRRRPRLARRRRPPRSPTSASRPSARRRRVRRRARGSSAVARAAASARAPSPTARRRRRCGLVVGLGLGLARAGSPSPRPSRPSDRGGGLLAALAAARAATRPLLRRRLRLAVLVCRCPAALVGSSSASDAPRRPQPSSATSASARRRGLGLAARRPARAPSPAFRRAGARVGFSASLSNVIGATPGSPATSVANAWPSSTRPIVTVAFLPTSFAASATTTSRPSSLPTAAVAVVQVDLDELQLELGALGRRAPAGARSSRRPSASTSKWSAWACPSAGTRKNRRRVASSSAASRAPPGPARSASVLGWTATRYAWTREPGAGDGERLEPALDLERDRRVRDDDPVARAGRALRGSSPRAGRPSRSGASSRRGRAARSRRRTSSSGRARARCGTPPRRPAGSSGWPCR